MSEHRADKRFRRRSACELHADGRKQRAIVLDLSRTGLFVQTSARLAPGTSVELLVHFEGQGEPMLLRARVARQNQVPSNLTHVARGGIGLYLLEAPKAYLEMVDLQNETRARNGPAPTPAAKLGDAPVFPHFRVRLKQIEGNRSRVLNVMAASAARACADALTQLGAGWEALGAERI